MEELSKMYLKKSCKDESEESSVYIFLKNIKNNEYCILKKIDTLTNESDIICVEKDEFIKEFYSSKDLICYKNYLGQKGYYKKMRPFEQALYKSYVVLYKDDFHELLYSSVKDTCFLAASEFKLEEFIPVSKEYVDCFKDLHKKKRG